MPDAPASSALFTTYSRGSAPSAVVPPMSAPSAPGVRLYNHCPPAPPSRLPTTLPAPNTMTMLVAAGTPMPRSCAI
jgi:hypothetical protein